MTSIQTRKKSTYRPTELYFETFRTFIYILFIYLTLYRRTNMHRSHYKCAKCDLVDMFFLKHEHNIFCVKCPAQDKVVGPTVQLVVELFNFTLS